MKFAILGGSFNPIHMGHLALAESVLDQLDYDRIIFIPASFPPHKEKKFLISSNQRLKMVQLALQNRQNMEVSDCEIMRDGPSFTIDTVLSLYKSHSFQGKPGLIIGDDWIKGFSSWKEVDKLVTLVDLIMARRESDESDCEFEYPCTFLDNTIVSISSTEIREKIMKGENIRPFVPSKVAEYIDIHGLYRDY
jgi:nicotinate-nucleotide adenylyltransferase